ncbi:MAG: hypothetical protein ACOCV8_05630 [Spirochaetota bacterium]
MKKNSLISFIKVLLEFQKEFLNPANVLEGHLDTFQNPIDIKKSLD